MRVCTACSVCNSWYTAERKLTLTTTSAAMSVLRALVMDQTASYSANMFWQFKNESLWFFFLKQNWRIHGWREKALCMFCIRPLPSVTNPSFVRYKKGRSAQVAGCWSLTTSWPPVAPCLPPPILSEGLPSKESWGGDSTVTLAWDLGVWHH